MGLIYFNAQRFANKLPLEFGTKLTDGIRSLGFTSIKYHTSEIRHIPWDKTWSMDEKEYLIFVLKYG